MTGDLLLHSVETAQYHESYRQVPSKLLRKLALPTLNQFLSLALSHLSSSKMLSDFLFLSFLFKVFDFLGFFAGGN